MRLSAIQGQPRAQALIQEILSTHSTGRSYILSGPRGVGKMTSALSLSRELLGDNLFNDPDFSFYRNDLFSLKTEWFISRLRGKTLIPQAKEYFQLLLARAGRGVSLGELKTSAQESLLEISEILHQPDWDQAFVDEKSSVCKSVIDLSQELESKKKLPIGFIRSLITEHEQKPSRTQRVSILADFEQASIEAQNAILKLLEEPPATSLLLLTTSEPEGLLPTIRSRAIIIPFQEFTPAVLGTLFGNRDLKARSSVEVMQEELYHKSSDSREKIVSFFRDIAPRVQHGQDLFVFIDQLPDRSGEEGGLAFLREMVEFLRQLNLLRVLRIQGKPTDKWILPLYLPLLLTLADYAHDGEVEEMVQNIARLIPLLERGNVKSKMVLPDLLINISRWYQKSRKKS